MAGLIARVLGSGTGSTGVPRSRVAGRAAWTFADQALFSLSSAALALVVASQVSPEEFGAFALTYSLYAFAVALAQAVAGQPLIVKFAAAPRPDHDRASGSAMGMAVIASSIGLTALLVAALLVAPPLQHSLFALALLLPGLLLQQLWRNVFNSRSTPSQAFWSDGLWLLLQLFGIGVLLLIGVQSAVWYVLAWGLGASAAALVNMLRTRIFPRPGEWRRWMRAHRDVALPSLGYEMAILGSMQVALVLVASIGSLSVVGALRASLTLMGPANLVVSASTAFVLPEIARRQLSGRRLIAAAGGLSAFLVLCNLVWGALFLALPDGFGRALLGETWSSARETLPWIVAYSCLTVATVGATLMMRAWNWASSVLWTSALLGPAVLVLSAAGTYLDGARGAAIGFASAAGLVTPLAWVLLVRVAARGRRGSPDGQFPSAA